MLSSSWFILLVSDFTGLDRSGSAQDVCFKEVPGFFDYLRHERGLREASIRLYRHHLRQFQGFLTKIHVDDLGRLSPTILDSFVLERSSLVGQRSLCNLCGPRRGEFRSHANVRLPTSGSTTTRRDDLFFVDRLVKIQEKSSDGRHRGEILQLGGTRVGTKHGCRIK